LNTLANSDIKNLSAARAGIGECSVIRPVVYPLLLLLRTEARGTEA
jgi:hypothetical protein